MIIVREFSVPHIRYAAPAQLATSCGKRVSVNSQVIVHVTGDDGRRLGWSSAAAACDYVMGYAQRICRVIGWMRAAALAQGSDLETK